MQKEICLYYWTADQEQKNIGDVVTAYILEKMGFKVAASETHFPPDVFRGTGTMPPDEKITGIVWGLGYAGHPGSWREHPATFHAVRGPVSRDLLSLPEDTPLGDLALLLPRLFSTQRTTPGTLFVGHVENESPVNLGTLDAHRIADTWITSEHLFESKVQELVDADLVLTNSLHASIFCQAFGTPWALCVPNGNKLPAPLKWKDWGAYLDIEITPVNTANEGRKWWSTTGSHGTIRDLTPLVEAFPYPRPNQSVRARLLTPPDHS
ncbi:MAG: hypothetical protein AAF591_03305 [Verrucomicrobiota bacterium]